MNAANALFFLNLWEPHANYFYQAGEAKAWADYFGYEADFGGGTALDLPRYYTMCNDLLHALENYPEIIAPAQGRTPSRSWAASTTHCTCCVRHPAHGLRRAVLPEGYTRGSTSRERAKAVKEKADRAELCIRIGECEQELQELLANPAALPDLTGCKINHKMFGAGTVRPAEGQFMVIDFNGTLKKVQLHSLDEQRLSLRRGPQREARLQAYQDYNKDKDRLEKELKNLKAELVKL